MNIITLIDHKGFTKTIDVPYFPPTYEVVDKQPISIGSMEDVIGASAVMPKTLTFIPDGKLIEDGSLKIRRYKQM